MKTITETHNITLANQPGAEVFITTKAGNGALAGGNLKLNGQILKKGMLNKFSLGQVDNLRGKTCIVRTNGLDVNPSTNIVPVAHTFSGNGVGANQKNFEFPEDGTTEVDPADGLIAYIITYTFN